MPKFAANLTMLFTELPFLDRIPAAAAAGFRGVEFLFPYEFPAAVRSPICSARHRLSRALHNLPAGNWAAGERGIACPPGPESASSATAWAVRSNTRRPSARPSSTACPASRRAGVAREAAEETLVENLRFAAIRAGGRRHPAAAGAGEHPRRPGLLPPVDPPGAGDHGPGRLREPEAAIRPSTTRR